MKMGRGWRKCLGELACGKKSATSYHWIFEGLSIERFLLDFRGDVMLVNMACSILEGVRLQLWCVGLQECVVYEQRLHQWILTPHRKLWGWTSTWGRQEVMEVAPIQLVECKGLLLVWCIDCVYFLCCSFCSSNLCGWFFNGLFIHIHSIKL